MDDSQDTFKKNLDKLSKTIKKHPHNWIDSFDKIDNLYDNTDSESRKLQLLNFKSEFIGLVCQKTIINHGVLYCLDEINSLLEYKINISNKNLSKIISLLMKYSNSKYSSISNNEIKKRYKQTWKYLCSSEYLDNFIASIWSLRIHFKNIKKHLFKTNEINRKLILYCLKQWNQTGKGRLYTFKLLGISKNKVPILKTKDEVIKNWESKKDQEAKNDIINFAFTQKFLDNKIYQLLSLII